MIKIKEYTDAYRDDVIALVLHCQNDGTRPIVGVENQPELLDIKKSYLKNGGYFWIATDDGKLAGTIGLMNCGNGIGILKKFFVYEQYRSNPYHLGRKLYEQLIEFARINHFKTLILDTPKNTDRAHKFYKKSGFRKIAKEELPVKFDYPYDDCDFFLLSLN